MKDVTALLKAEAEVLKRLFDLCDKNEGITGKVHIIDNSPHYDDTHEFRVYHADGYCFDVKREETEVEPGESNVEIIDGYCYEYFDMYDGFKPLPPALAIELILKEAKHVHG